MNAAFLGFVALVFAILVLSLLHSLTILRHWPLFLARLDQLLGAPMSFFAKNAVRIFLTRKPPDPVIR